MEGIRMGTRMKQLRMILRLSSNQCSSGWSPPRPAFDGAQQIFHRRVRLSSLRRV